MGISSAFFRFYFDSPEPERRRLVLRTSFWFTMTHGDARADRRGRVLAARSRSVLFGTTDERGARRGLVRRALGGMNYEQLTSLFRVEERSVAFVVARASRTSSSRSAPPCSSSSRSTRARSGVIVGNFTGTLVVYLALVGYRREQLGLQFDRRLLREMNRFGIPLVPTALFLWATNFSDRLFLVKLADTTEVGLYSVGVRIASAMVLLLTAFRLAWPAFAYSIEDDREARAHVRVRPHVPRARHDLGRDRPRRCSRRGSSSGSRRPTFAERLAGRRPARLRGRRVRRATSWSRSASAERGARSSTGS